MKPNRSRLIVVVSLAAISVAGVAGCGKNSPDAKASASAQVSAQATEVRPTGAPGGIVGVNMNMALPSGSNHSTYVYGTLKNFGAQTSIVRAEAFVAQGGAVLQQNGATAAGGIPAPVGTTNKTVIALTPAGYRIQLNGVDLTLDNDGQITLNLFGANGTVSQVQVTVGAT